MGGYANKHSVTLHEYTQRDILYVRSWSNKDFLGRLRGKIYYNKSWSRPRCY